MNEQKQKKVSENLCGILQRVKYLEETKDELDMIRATLNVNFGEKGRVKELFSGDLTTMSMLMKVLDFLTQAQKMEG